MTSIALGAIGAEAVTNVIDRNIDSLMQRTKCRPLPSGAIGCGEALALGMITIAASLTLAGSLGALPLLLIAIGLLDNIVVYSLLSKRTTPWSIVLGSISGGVPVWAAFAAVRLPISAAGWLLGVLVMVWIPLHIWSIAYMYADDYRLAGVPVAPVAWSRRRFTSALAAASVLMLLIAIVANNLIWSGEAIPLLLADLAAAAMLAFTIGFARKPSEQGAKKLFMACNVYLLLLFLGVIFTVVVISR